ncbi:MULTISPECIES: N-acetylmuramoyl-L-alanine amidase [unclassified Myxococcus]|jgi:N-acetyl-anhydromuramyl-L-alanine amidase AmpD|uniref:golvesin C-terminal-like domain-containing protein n=1 Tax=Myxococcus TaxID=32 RepID=UPI001CBFE36A|nr:MULTISPECIES: N-acetylmuramoyl-L-alanine amidase [unclassified Myxococcus]MBZ4395387.1 N-acetylmuramoyl-L-alanine amidase [Myxococcus sp. AS-1-15]MBZ4413859.1 N-acetylmuramoyl-L-alanine amidase [Myxococcus sp. XM-1-1-1]BDT30736.1 N-acetylmuramoyl-L-alanine amidase [Myxococcus sp. MH1]
MHVLSKTFAATAAALALSACGPQQEAPPPEAPPSTEVPSGAADDAARAIADQARRTPSELDALFAQAAKEFDVPVSLLKAISYTETRWEHVKGEEEFEGRPAAFGLLALRGEKITQGAALAGVTEDQVRGEPLANLRAGAALLSRHAAEAGIDRKDLGAWAPVAVALTDITDPDVQAYYVHNEVYATLRDGAGAFTPEGKVAVSLEGAAVEAKFALPRMQAMAAGPDYAASIWRASPNYNARPSGTNVSMIIIHTCEGGYSGCWGWLTNSAAGVSAHYVVNESGSEISQLVRESNRAWHVGASYDCNLNGKVDCGLQGTSVNHFSVGIEHGGFASQSSFPAGQIDASAKLSCDITKGQGIVRDSYHIVAHGRLQPASRTDPGPNWPWSSYISKIKSYCGDGGTPTGTIVVDSHNANNDTSKARADVPASWAAGTSAGYYGSGYYYASTQPISEPVVFNFYLASAGTKTIDAWWVAGTNRSPAAPFIINHAGGNATVTKNQQTGGSAWNTLGTYSFNAGWNTVQLSRWATEGYVVMADAIRVR